MKRYLIFFILVFGFCFANHGFAELPYIGIIGGGSGHLDIKSPRAEGEFGYYVGGNLGFKFCSLLRLEEELAYQHSRIHSVEKKGFHLHHVKGDVNVWSLMTNLLVDLDCPFFIHPYLGGGIGYANAKGHWSGEWVEIHRHIHTHHIEEDFRKNGFAWQLIGGLKFSICFDVEAGLEYRYLKIPEGSANHRLGLALTIQL